MPNTPMPDTDTPPADQSYAEPGSVPAVVAVVVTHNPGDWLEECIASLASQDYPNLSVLVLDAASTEDPTRRVAGVMPGAFVRRLADNPGYAAATNDVLEVVEGASHLLLCHDDVALDPDAVRVLVEEAYRSNAGIVAPKLVAWDDPSQLLQVGATVDKMGMAVPLVERGELDQEQHDGVRDVFCAPSGCLLIRADLFRSLGGFDPAMVFCGEDIDLGWRAQVAGARVVVAPSARVRHREAASAGLRLPPGASSSQDLEGWRLRHAMRAALKSYGPAHRLRVLPQAVIVSLFRMLAALVSAKPRLASGIAGAWRWNMAKANRTSLKAARREVHRSRAVSDSEVRRLQSRGTAGLSAFAREHHLTATDQERLVEAANRGVAVAFRPSAFIGTAMALGVVLLFGSRSLLSGELSALGDQLPFTDGPLELLRTWSSAWRLQGLGGEGFGPPAFALLGVAGTVFLGAMGLLQKVLVLGLIPLGLVGAVRMAGPLHSDRARLAVLVAYAAIPVPWNALASGRWSGLIAWAFVPWVAASLVAVGDGRASSRRTMFGLGIATAVAGAFSPGVFLIVLVVGLALALGSALGGRVGALPMSVIGTAAGAAGVGAALLFPWSALAFLAPTEAGRAIPFSLLLRFESGPLGGPPAGWAWMAAAALPLVIGRSWRLSWAAGAWAMAVAGWALAWGFGRGWVPLPLHGPESLLALSAAGLTFAIGLGVVAFERDLPAYKFGWRQIAPPAAALALALGVLPVLGSALGGRWNQPVRDLRGTLSFLDEAASDKGEYRVLWLGRAAAVPGHPWRLAQFADSAYTVARTTAPAFDELWPTLSPGATAKIPEALSFAAAGDTTQMGRMLAPMGIRYVAVAVRPAPEEPAAQPPRALTEALDRQVDLGRIEGEDSVILYENAAWVPARSSLEGGTLLEGGLEEAASTDLSGAIAAFPTESGGLSFRGDLESGTRLLLAESPSANWRLNVGSSSPLREAAFGVANVWDVEVGGEAHLRYRSPLWYWAWVGAQVLAWGLAVRWIWRQWRRRRGERRALRHP